jgi:hypothetical protein
MVIGNPQSFENCIYWDIVFPFSDRHVNHWHLYSGQAFFSPVQIVILFATIVIAGNWSINISGKLSKRKAIIGPYLVLTRLIWTFAF